MQKSAARNLALLDFDWELDDSEASENGTEVFLVEKALFWRVVAQDDDLLRTKALKTSSLDLTREGYLSAHFFNADAVRSFFGDHSSIATTS